MSNQICLTGIKPTGIPHWGNYFGAIKPALDLLKKDKYDAYFFIADYHALINIHDPKILNQYIYEVAATWIALGLNTDNAVLYRQSSIPEILELNWILNCFSSKGLLNRAHAYKAACDKNHSEKRDTDYAVSMGLFNYPVLMSADILFVGSDVVPVGADQLQHIEIARDIANAFNHHYGDILKLPKPVIHDNKLLTPGLDGRKMSKSYGNHIPLFLESKKLRKIIMKIKTDSTPPNVAKDPNNSIIFDLYSLFASEDEIENFRQAYAEGISWGEAKELLFLKADTYLSSARLKYFTLIEDKIYLDSILDKGAEKVKKTSSVWLGKIKKSIGLI